MSATDMIVARIRALLGNGAGFGGSTTYSRAQERWRERLTPLAERWTRFREGRGSDTLIRQRAISGPVPWVIAIMTALTVIATAGGLALGAVASAAGNELAGGVTVQIAGPPEAQSARQAQAVVAALQDDPAVISLRRLDRAERAALLSPWMGESGLNDAGGEISGERNRETGDDSLLMLPELVEVQLSDVADDAALAHLRERLADVAPDALISADTAWLAPVGEAIDALQWLALALVGLLAVATAAAVLLASRSALAANREVIELMHLLGAADRQVASLFQRAAAIGAGAGGATGFAVAIAAITLLSARFAALGPDAAASGAGAGAGAIGGGLTSAGLSPLHWAVLALIPIMATALAALTARLTVMAVLRRML